MDTAEGEPPSHADCFATAILIYLHLTVSVEMSKPLRSNGILLMCDRVKREERKTE